MSDGKDGGGNVLNLSVADMKESTGRFTCKFVLIRFDDEMHLVFGPVRLYPYHANLIEQFCLKLEIPLDWERHPDLCAVYDTRVELRGGGYFDINQAKKKVLASGRSTAYGPFERPELQRLLQRTGVFDGYRVEIQSR